MIIVSRHNDVAPELKLRLGCCVLDDDKMIVESPNGGLKYGDGIVIVSDEISFQTSAGFIVDLSSSFNKIFLLRIPSSFSNCLFVFQLKQKTIIPCFIDQWYDVSRLIALIHCFFSFNSNKLIFDFVIDILKLSFCSLESLTCHKAVP